MMQLAKGSLAAICVAILLACSGGSDGGPAGPNDPNDPNPNNAGLSARIDGVQYTPIVVQVATSQNPPMIAIGSADASGRALGFAFSAANGPGTQTIGLNSLANCNFTQGAAGYLATGTMGSGTITITTLTANRAAGTFTFTVEATTAGVTPAARQITQGTFDVSF